MEKSPPPPFFSSMETGIPGKAEWTTLRCPGNNPGRSPWFTKLKYSMKEMMKKSTNRSNGVKMSVSRLPIITGRNFQPIGIKFNPICISKCSRGNFFIFSTFLFFDLSLSNFRKIQGHFFIKVIEG